MGKSFPQKRLVIFSSMYTDIKFHSVNIETAKTMLCGLIYEITNYFVSVDNPNDLHGKAVS